MTDGFDPGSIAHLDEPVRRYLTHAIAPGTPLGRPVRMEMDGRIRVRRWRRFTATESCDGRSYRWDARLRAGPLTVLEVVDSFGAGEACTDGMLFGHMKLFHAGDEHTTRSAAGRAALEATWCPTSLLPERGVEWRAESDTRIVASFAVPPEDFEMTLEIDAAGALKSVVLPRWSDVGREGYGYVPCGGTPGAERTFGGLTVPSEVTVAWWHGTEQALPYFRATIREFSAG
jgi:hypothetical protein